MQEDYYMSVRKAEDRDVRKIQHTGQSLAITIPVTYLRKLGWKAKQKLTVRLKGNKVVVEDWEKKS